MILEAILVLTGVAALGSVVNIFMKNIANMKIKSFLYVIRQYFFKKWLAFCNRQFAYIY